jgi:dephospho-CoA kinase
MPYVVGLTGGIGSGKSTVAAFFRANGAVVVDADSIAREITTVGSPVLEEIQKAFGEDILDSDGKLRRQLLAQRAFASSEMTDVLNSIMHERIRERAIGEIELSNGESIVVYDMPLLVETNSVDMCDFVVVVDTPVAQRIERLKSGRGMTELEIRERIAMQASDHARNAAADFIIKNDRDLDHLMEQCNRAWTTIMGKVTAS